MDLGAENEGVDSFLDGVEVLIESLVVGDIVHKVMLIIIEEGLVLSRVGRGLECHIGEELPRRHFLLTTRVVSLVTKSFIK